jgi:hypothetical protein
VFTFGRTPPYALAREIRFMNRPLVAVLVLAALGVGYLVGAATYPSGPSARERAETRALRAEVERWRLALGERGPRLDPGAALRGRGGSEDPDGDGAPADGFDITRHDNAEDAFRALVDFAAAKLAAGGAEDHLALLETINRTLYRNPGAAIARQMLGTDAQAARFQYPLLRFALNHDVEIAALAETVYRTLAEDPRRLAELSGDLLEVVAERIGYVLPGMVGPERLETFSGYALAILETPPGKQPECVRRIRRDIQRVLDSWAPPLRPEEALARLQAGGGTPEEIASLLGRLTPDMMRALDLDALIGPLLEGDGFRVLGLLVRLRPDEDTLEKLDRRVTDGVLRGGGNPAFVPYYLRFTGRDTWAKGRDFIEGGLQQAEEDARGAFGVAALGLGEGPPVDWIRWALGKYTFPREVQVALEKRLQ